MNICFATNELFPYRPGGIGRLMYNFAVQNRDLGEGRCNMFFLVPSLDVRNWRELATFYRINDLGTVVATPPKLGLFSEMEATQFDALRVDESNEKREIRQSLDYLNGLIYLEQKYGIKLDIIEFPDFGGWGFSTLAARAAGIAFGGATITVRLHSTAGLIAEAEPFYHKASKAQKTVFELERQCLLHADHVISHLAVIADTNQRFYRFDASWRDKVAEEFPPIFLEDEEVALPFQEEAVNFIFSSRIQPFKRPDLFIRAAILFLDRSNDYRGSFYLASYGWDPKYIEWLRALIPPRHKGKIVFIVDPDAALRNSLLQRSIVVIPSSYESLCLFAYESSQRGAKVILNEACAAFGASRMWRDGENCVFFDGTPEDLARACETALGVPRLQPVVMPESRCYWHRGLPERRVSKRLAASAGRLAIVALGFASVAQANEKLAELAPLAGRPDIDLHILLEREEYRAIARDPGVSSERKAGNLRLHSAPWRSLGASDIGRLLEAENFAYCALVTPDCKVDPLFYETAMKALDRHPEYQIVTSHVRWLTDKDLKSNAWQHGDRADAGAIGTLRVTPGCAPSVVPYDMNVVSPFSCFRKELLSLAHELDESGAYFARALMALAVRRGMDVLTLPRVLITEQESGLEKGHLSEDRVLDGILALPGALPSGSGRP